MKDQEQSLERLLAEWNVPFKPDSALLRRLRDGMAVAEEERRPAVRAAAASGWLRGLAALLLAGLIFSVGIIWEQGRSATRPAEVFLLTIDPLAKVERVAGSGSLGDATGFSPGSSGRTVEWVRRELNLSGAQARVFEALHESYLDHFDRLFEGLFALRARYLEFEARRMSDNAIDFIAFYDLLQRQRELEAHSGRLTEQYLAEMRALLKPAQRNAFEGILERGRASRYTGPEQTDV